MTKIRKTDKELLKIYMQGFNDELNSISSNEYTGIELKAYTLGRNDAFIGDDLSSVDNNSDEVILNRILK